MEEDIKNLSEIIELCEEEINNNDENVSAILDLTDLKSLRNLINRNKDLEEEIEKINKQLDLDYVDNNYIPVSLVEEKIDRIFGEECKKLGSYIKDDSTSEKERIAGGINILNKIKRELLEKRK